MLYWTIIQSLQKGSDDPNDLQKFFVPPKRTDDLQNESWTDLFAKRQPLWMIQIICKKILTEGRKYVVIDKDIDADGDDDNPSYKHQNTIFAAETHSDAGKKI